MQYTISIFIILINKIIFISHFKEKKYIKIS